MSAKKTLRTCPKGHTYYKSSDCPTCPQCENKKVPAAAFMQTLAAPARRALENAGIKSETQLATFTKEEILALHGIGPASMPALEAALSALNLNFKP